MNKIFQTTSKIRFAILLFPLGWVLFSIWIMAIDISRVLEGQEARVLSSAPIKWSIAFLGLMALWELGDMILKRYRAIPISIEQKSLLAFFLGSTLLGISSYVRFGYSLAILAILLIDVLPVMMTSTLLQGKSFGKFRLYERNTTTR